MEHWNHGQKGQVFLPLSNPSIIIPLFHFSSIPSLRAQDRSSTVITLDVVLGSDIYQI